MLRRRRACVRVSKRCRRCFRRSPRADGRHELSEKPTMRLSQRLIAATVLIALSGALAGCSGAGWDPTDMLDFLDTKKKLPGKREPVFPDGVPGLQQGVPQDLYKGNVERQEQADEAAAAAATAAPPPGAEDPNGKKGAGAAAPQEGAAAASEPAKPKKKVVHRKPKAPA